MRNTDNIRAERLQSFEAERAAARKKIEDQRRLSQERSNWVELLEMFYFKLEEMSMAPFTKNCSATAELNEDNKLLADAIRIIEFLRSICAASALNVRNLTYHQVNPLTNTIGEASIFSFSFTGTQENTQAIEATLVLLHKIVANKPDQTNLLSKLRNTPLTPELKQQIKENVQSTISQEDALSTFLDRHDNFISMILELAWMASTFISLEWNFYSTNAKHLQEQEIHRIQFGPIEPELLISQTRKAVQDYRIKKMSEFNRCSQQIPANIDQLVKSFLIIASIAPPEYQQKESIQHNAFSLSTFPLFNRVLQKQTLNTTEMLQCSSTIQGFMNTFGIKLEADALKQQAATTLLSAQALQTSVSSLLENFGVLMENTIKNTGEVQDMITQTTSSLKKITNEESQKTKLESNNNEGILLQTQAIQKILTEDLSTLNDNLQQTGKRLAA